MCNFEQRIASHGDIFAIGSLCPLHKMRRKPKTEVAEMWINPNSILSRGYVAWDRRKTDSMNARYLDLAEVALRTKMGPSQEPVNKPESRKAKTAAALAGANPTKTQS